jgi:hypothetical protein
MAYNEEEVAAFETVRQAVLAMNLPLMKQRRYNGIFNAINMLIEDEPPCKEAYTHLRSGLIALVRFDMRAEDAERIEAACRNFEAHPACRMQ